MQGIHALLTLHLLGLFMVRHRRIMLVSSAGYLPGMKGRLDWILWRPFPNIWKFVLLVFWLWNHQVWFRGYPCLWSSLDISRWIRVCLLGRFCFHGTYLAWCHRSYFPYVQIRGDINFECIFYQYKRWYAFSLVLVVGDCHMPRMDRHIFHVKIILSDFWDIVQS